MPFLHMRGSDDTVLRILKFFWSMCENSIEDRDYANGALGRASATPFRSSSTTERRFLAKALRRKGKATSKLLCGFAPLRENFVKLNRSFNLWFEGVLNARADGGDRKRSVDEDR